MLNYWVGMRCIFEDTRTEKTSPAFVRFDLYPISIFHVLWLIYEFRCFLFHKLSDIEKQIASGCLHLQFTEQCVLIWGT